MGEEEGAVMDGHGRWPAQNREYLYVGVGWVVAVEEVGGGWVHGSRWAMWGAVEGGYGPRDGMRGCACHAAQHQVSCGVCVVGLSSQGKE